MRLNKRRHTRALNGAAGENTDHTALPTAPNGGFMNKLPKDPMLLLSVVNMKLRDVYLSLSALCEDMDEDEQEIVAALSKIGYAYSPEHNQFR